MKKFLMLVLLITALPLHANSLKNHPAPYLALHGDDPVEWMEWGEAALEKARKENKLLFISVGYFSCHWCHVMQRESFSDKPIAAKLNNDYVSVKVDRELNPVLDKRLIEFVQVTNGTAGWPLNVFVTPEGYSLVGMTYLPPKNFSSVLDQLTSKWKEDDVDLSKRSKEMSATLDNLLNNQEEKVSGSIESISSKYVDTAMLHADHLQGGFGEQLKFPQIPQLMALLKLNRERKVEDADDFLNLTLEKIATQGLHDEIAGGFYRYTTDPNWEIPHYEKMIYTNALMPILFFDAAEHYKNPSYRETGLETLYFLQNEMQGSSNAYIASLSAVDDKNIEGGYYLWQQSELKEILTTEELSVANSFWNMTRRNDHPTGNLPRQKIDINELSKQLAKSLPETKSLVSTIKKKMKLHRNKTRNIPKDTKLLVGMNGLVLTAFSKGVKFDKSLKQSGDQLSQFLTNLWDGKTLRRSAANNKPGGLYDYAAASWGLMHWGIANNDDAVKNTGLAIAQAAWNKFYQNGLWIEDSNSLLPNAKKQAHIPDSALISPEALLLEASFLTKNPALIKKAKIVTQNITKSLANDLFAYSSMLSIQK